MRGHPSHGVLISIRQMAGKFNLRSLQLVELLPAPWPLWQLLAERLANQSFWLAVDNAEGFWCVVLGLVV